MHEGNLKKPGKQEFIDMVSFARAKISKEVVQNSFFAAEILRKPQITVRETVEEEKNGLDVSFSVASFFSSGEEDCNDSDGCGSDNDEGGVND